jgi:hypothetical protein
MPRQNRRRADAAVRAARPLTVLSERREQWRGEEYAVRAVTGQADASKHYRCPGCDQFVRSGAPHVVVWAAEDTEAGDRRHWHSACWAARERRAPGVQRGRSAPRY